MSNNKDNKQLNKCYRVIQDISYTTTVHSAIESTIVALLTTSDKSFNIIENGIKEILDLFNEKENEFSVSKKNRFSRAKNRNSMLIGALFLATMREVFPMIYIDDFNEEIEHLSTKIYRYVTEDINITTSNIFEEIEFYNKIKFNTDDSQPFFYRAEKFPKNSIFLGTNFNSVNQFIYYPNSITINDEFEHFSLCSSNSKGDNLATDEIKNVANQIRVHTKMENDPSIIPTEHISDFFLKNDDQLIFADSSYDLVMRTKDILTFNNISLQNNQNKNEKEFYEIQRIINSPYGLKEKDQFVKKASGNIIIQGMDDGYLAYIASQSEKINKITIIEDNKELIDFMVNNTFNQFENVNKIEVIHGTIDDYIEAINNRKYDFYFSMPIYIDKYIKIKSATNSAKVNNTIYFEEFVYTYLVKYASAYLINLHIEKLSDQTLKVFDIFETYSKGIANELKNLKLKTPEQIRLNLSPTKLIKML